MACSFERSPRILRLYGQGSFIQPDDPQWGELHDRFPERISRRQIMVIAIESVQLSCGYGVPMAENMVGRETLDDWGERKGREDVLAYQRENNLTSIDGLPTGLK